MMKSLILMTGSALLLGATTLFAATNVVQIGNFFFSPTNLTINVGDTVLWTNTVAATMAHDSTRTNAGSGWSSGTLNASKRSFSLVFSNAGTFEYVCATHVYAFMPSQRHPEQTGTVFVVTANLPPSVSLTNPANNAKFRAPANILLQATATDPGGSVANVQFYSNEVFCGSAPTAPYNFMLSNVAPGNYSFTARALDNGGLSATSALVNVSVLTNAILREPTRLPDGKFRLTMEGIAGQPYTTEISTNLTGWSPIFTNVAPANTFNVTDSTAPGVLLRFYRARQDL
jgi:plastocyanin